MRGDVRRGGNEESCGELWQQREQKNCGKEEMTKAVIGRRVEKESCDKEERRRAVARRRAVRVHLDVISR